VSNLGKYQTRNPLKRALLKRFLRQARANVPDNPELSILDVGTGEGLFWDSSERGCVVGVDIRQDALKVAADGGIVTPVLASADRLPFPSGSFDFVVAIEILEHLPDPESAVAEIARVARLGGVITVPWEPWFSLMVLAGTGQHARRLGREPEHVQAFGPGQLTALLESHFSVVSVGTCLPWLVARISKGR
jgi:ubiquinone/menaquinone biosynthesis C-methylase UbiE